VAPQTRDSGSLARAPLGTRSGVAMGCLRVRGSGGGLFGIGVELFFARRQGDQLAVAREALEFDVEARSFGVRKRDAHADPGTRFLPSGVSYSSTVIH
jgi:hypothetical protein